MKNKNSDYIYHPPSGSEVPGKVEANPYMNYPPDEIRKLIKVESDEGLLEKMNTALKEWERIYVYPGFPYREPLASRLKKIALGLKRMAAVQYPAINLPNEYQDAEFPYGYEGIMEGLISPHDRYDMKELNYTQQGERPEKDIPFFQGDFLAPTTGIPEVVLEPGSHGPNPNELEYEFPPTGGDIF